MSKLRNTVALAFFAAVVSFPASAHSLDEIKQSGELRVCVVPIHPSAVSMKPEGCHEDCDFGGPAIEAVTAFAKTLNGVEPVFRQVGWDAQFQNADGVTTLDDNYRPALLADGTCDVMPSHLTVTDWRQKKAQTSYLISVARCPCAS